MASLTVQVVSALGTSSKTLTFSAGDATRIFNAYKSQVKLGGTQDEMVAWLAAQAQRLINQTVVGAENVTPAPPSMT